MGQVFWSWSWIPTVQYPLGEKNFYQQMTNKYFHLNETNEQCSYLELPGDLTEVNSFYKTDFDLNCPTFYYQDGETNVKFCPQNSQNYDQTSRNTTATSTMIIYDYSNEQNDGFYTCEARVGSKKTCCQPEVYYASPNWNGWCWFGMFYG